MVGSQVALSLNLEGTELLGVLRADFKMLNCTVCSKMHAYYTHDYLIPLVDLLKSDT